VVVLKVDILLFVMAGGRRKLTRFWLIWVGELTDFWLIFWGFWGFLEGLDRHAAQEGGSQ
jgi:hypothetical protein